MASKRSRATFEADLQAQQSPYVVYGTPLPPLDPDTRDDGSYVPVWKQEVTDEQGRKRLHGAFTGGFSAGYFNTVGSKEGWTPSTFVSSRSNRKKDVPPTPQKPEDFMDDEDMAEAEEATKLQTTETFAGLGSANNEASQNDPFNGILRTSGETMGVKLLKKMGWRQGQGVGPKVRRKARLNEEQRMDGDASQETHLFAPENSTMISFIKKNDRKGLGCEAETRLTAETPKPQSTEAEVEVEAAGFGMPNNGNRIRKKKPGRKGGFGVGILNDNGSDDEDPYAMGPQISYNRVAGGEKRKKKNLEINRPCANPLLSSKPVFISKKTGAGKAGTYFRKCHDGRLPLEGFILPSNMDPLFSILSQDGKYPPPAIPQEWKSIRTSSPSTTSALGQSAYQPSATVAAARRHSPKSRAALLGESLLPGKSVFDYLTPNARNRIASATNNENLPPALNEASCHLSSHPKTLLSLVPPLAAETARAALGRGTAGWMPYAEDLGKRARYRAFLEISAGIRPEGTLPDRQPGSTNDDWVNEMNEFMRAAQVFKPMTGAMANRFTSSNVRLEGATDSTEDSSLLTKPAGRTRTPAEEAAAVGMYGPLTRSSETWYPTRLLCKRFNIQPPAHVQVPGDAPPEPDDAIKGACSAALPKKNSELVGKKEMEDLRISGGVGYTPLQVPEVRGEDNVGANGIVSQARDEVVVVDPERNEALEKERPGEAVFRAIFGSDTIGLGTQEAKPRIHRYWKPTIKLSATRDSSDGSSVSDKVSFRASIAPSDAESPFTESADDPITAAPPAFTLPSSPPPFSSLYFPAVTSSGPLEASITEPPPPAFTPVSAATRAEAETKAALPADNKGESSKNAEDEEAPPPYTEGSSPLDSFTYVMAAAGGAASIITQVQQGGPAPVNTLADVGADEHITLDLRGTRFTLSRDELLTLPEFVLLSLFPNGLLPDGHMNSFHEGDIYPVDYDPQSLQYMLEFFRTVAQTIPSGSPSPTSETPAPSIDPSPNSARDMLQDRAGIIVLREDLDFYAIPPKADIDQTEMIEVKRAAGRALLKQDGIFSGLRRSEETGTTEQHLIEMLTAGGFNSDDRWGHRAGEPQKAVICSLALARLRTDIKGSEGVANSNAVGMAQKLLLFWRKPARRCWWEGVELDDVEGIEGKLKVWIRRVWTLEMSVIGLR